ncbi:ribonuclease HI family protein [Loigolactobacillus zhaoyuanensis]|uniref:Ribonuclease HI family protein n=1 Tax=Loigolactobacillus zhaoyuanensis TaxID=2486017 RepID=A0ABW8UAP4_9LACO|nr:ribonuclease HI family protein [Loigolactobacillus zhaoyuanensis]
MIILATDAATKGSPGPSAAGAVISYSQQRLQLKQVLPEMDNHHAEFAAVLFGLHALHERGLTHETLELRTDSKLVYTSLEKGYAKHFQVEVDQILALERSFPLVLHVWEPDHQHRGPHMLAQQALFNQLNTKK